MAKQIIIEIYTMCVLYFFIFAFFNRNLLNLIELIGYMAAFCTTIAFLPQAIKVHKTRSARDLSLGMFSLFTTGIVLWLIYGIIILNKPMIAANACTLILASYILIYKIRFK